jgi:hypothetical protein
MSGILNILIKFSIEREKKAEGGIRTPRCIVLPIFIMGSLFHY